MKKKFVGLLFIVLFFSNCCASDLAQGSYYLVRLFDDFYNKKYFLNQIGQDQYTDIIDYSNTPFKFQFLTTHTITTEHAFNRNFQQVSLAEHIFGKNPLFLSDISLSAYLAEQNKFSVDSSCSDCVSMENQYLPNLASLELCFNASQTITKFDFSLSRVVNFEKTAAKLILGINFPIIYQKHMLEMSLSSGALSVEDTITDGTSMELFFKEFNSSDDFMRSFVLNFCKNLCLKKTQRVWGLSDLSLWSAIDLGPLWDGKYDLILGMNFLLPTSNKISGNIIWEPQLGNGGATLFNPFFNCMMHINKIINFSCHIAGFFSPEFCANRRIAKLENLNSETLASETNLCLPSNLSCYLVSPFSAYDSVSAQFADHNFPVSIKRGSGILFRIGNSIYDIGDITPLKASIFYGFFFKYGDHIKVRSSETTQTEQNVGQKSTVQCEDFDICALNESHRSIANFIEWKLSCEVKDDIWASLGSLHVIGGKNMIKRNEFVFKINSFF